MVMPVSHENKKYSNLPLFDLKRIANLLFAVKPLSLCLSLTLPVTIDLTAILTSAGALQVPPRAEVDWTERVNNFVVHDPAVTSLHCPRLVPVKRMPENYWLFKAEPDSRIVKGKDVKFSVDDFEAVKTSPWEGVRNYEARNLMKEMRVGDKALFYQSNCKSPGVAAFAEVSKEAYPDYSAWDPEHPYYDPKTDKEHPKWFMVDLTFTSRAEHFVSLALLKRIADSFLDQTPKDVGYIGLQGCKAIKEMDLVTRGRLSVQRISEKAWVAIQLLAETGGWDETPRKQERQKTARKKAVPSEELRFSDEEDISNIQDVAGTKSNSSAKKRKREPNASGDRNQDNGTQKRRATRSRRNDT